MFTGTCLVGPSYNIPDVDRIYIYATPYTESPRKVLQQAGRCRNEGRAFPTEMVLFVNQHGSDTSALIDPWPDTFEGTREFMAERARTSKAAYKDFPVLCDSLDINERTMTFQTGANWLTELSVWQELELNRARNDYVQEFKARALDLHFGWVNHHH